MIQTNKKEKKQKKKDKKTQKKEKKQKKKTKEHRSNRRHAEKVDDRGPCMIQTDKKGRKKKKKRKEKKTAATDSTQRRLTTEVAYCASTRTRYRRSPSSTPCSTCGLVQSLVAMMM